MNAVLRRGRRSLGVALLGATAFLPALAPSVALASTTYASDGFQRTVSSGWASAGTGGAWTIEGTASGTSVNGSVGLVRLPTASATRSAILRSVSARDADVSFRASADKVGTGYGQYIDAVARNASGNEYRVRLRLSGGAAYLGALRLAGTAETRLGTEVKVGGLTVAAGTAIKVRAQFTGANPTKIQTRAWLASATEPTTWAYSTSDSTAGLQGNGALGLRGTLGSNTTNAPAVLSFDDYLVSATTGTIPPPAGSYVSTTGSDSNPGTYDRPWRTLQRAADVGTGAVWIRGGTYTGMKLQRSGLTFAGYAGEAVTISGGPGGVADVINVYDVTSATLKDLSITGAVNKGAGILVGSSSNVTISHVTARNNKAYGIRTWYATNTIVRDSDIYKNQEGIRVSYTATGTQILNNKVHENDTMINPAVKDAGGGVGIAFLKTTGSLTASGNQLWKNRAPDQFYVYDGGAFEIFGASDVTITGNTMWDNKQVLETGTDGAPCNNNRFTRNVAYAASSAAGYARGLLFACMSNSTVANNVLDGFDISAVSVVNKAGYQFAGSLDGLRIINNVLRSTRDNLYYLDNPPPTVTINWNVAYNTAGRIAYSVQKGSTTSWTTFRTWYGYEGTGTYADPKFTNVTGHDYHLQSTSPAIDRGTVLAGVTDSFMGLAPDSGRYETR